MKANAHPPHPSPSRPMSDNDTPNSEPVQVQAKVSYGPMIATTVVTTAAAVLTTIFVTRYFERQREEKALEREREREEAAALNPGMPMMFPGLLSPQQPSTPNPGPDLNALTDRLETWQRSLEEREDALQARSEHLQMVVSPREAV